MKTALVTGGTSGIGKATVAGMAAMGWQVVFVARNIEKAKIVQKEIISLTGNNNISYIIADLTSLKQVKDSIDTFRRNFNNLDVLINNAGVLMPRRRITGDGMEVTFQINHLSYFMYSILLIDMLKKSDDPRIIIVSSGGHASGKFDPANFQSEKEFTPFGAYSSTKLLNLLFCFELADRLKNTKITVNALHPGVVNTSFGSDFKGLWRIVDFIVKPFLISAKKGAETPIYLATSDGVKNVTGKYFVKCKQAPTENAAITSEKRKLLWEKSLELSGLSWH